MNRRLVLKFLGFSATAGAIFREDAMTGAFAWAVLSGVAFDRAGFLPTGEKIEDPAEAERIFHTLAENGQVQMRLEKTFWAALFGMLVHQFGIPWMINCEPAA